MPLNRHVLPLLCCLLIFSHLLLQKPCPKGLGFSHTGFWPLKTYMAWDLPLEKVATSSFSSYLWPGLNPLKFICIYIVINKLSVYAACEELSAGSAHSSLWSSNSTFHVADARGLYPQTLLAICPKNAC